LKGPSVGWDITLCFVGKRSKRRRSNERYRRSEGERAMRGTKEARGWKPGMAG
jgi:hypothetical protein